MGDSRVSLITVDSGFISGDYGSGSFKEMIGQSAISRQSQDQHNSPRAVRVNPKRHELTGSVTSSGPFSCALIVLYEAFT